MRKAETWRERKRERERERDGERERGNRMDRAQQVDEGRGMEGDGEWGGVGGGWAERMPIDRSSAQRNTSGVLPVSVGLFCHIAGLFFQVTGLF